MLCWGTQCLEMAAPIADSSCYGPSAASGSPRLIQSQGSLGQPVSLGPSLASCTEMALLEGPSLLETEL